MLAKLKSKKYAIVDLEATSANSDAKIIQVGIVLVKDGKIYGTYTTDVNPHEELSPHIKNLTGITDSQLAKAPDFSQVARAIYELLEDAVFVAHNVKFDANLLAEALFFEGFELRTPRVDTVELAQVLFPTFERYNLSYLAEVLNLKLDEAHTAIADAQATAQLFLRLQAKLCSLPKLTVTRLLSMAEHLIYETGQVIAEIYQQMSEKPLGEGYKQVLDLVVKPSRIFSTSYQLSEDFSHNMALIGLGGRPPQLQFAEIVAHHLMDFRTSFIEAQSGIGKTYGYLLPILALSKGRKIIVAAPTKILQDQIMASEGKAISETFHINFHNLKGYSNYIKLDTFWSTLDREESSRLVYRHKMQILVWLTETETGDLDELRQKHQYQAYFDELRHDGKLNASSLFAEVDYWQQGRLKAQISQVILTNQPYLLTRIEDDPAFVEDAILVIDEAQKLLLNLEIFSRHREQIITLLQEVDSTYQESSQILPRRLLENLRHHLISLAEAPKNAMIDEGIVQSIRRDTAELGPSVVPVSTALFSPKYDTHWITVEVSSDKQTRWLNAANINFLQFSKMLPETCKVFCVSATLEISPQVSLTQLLGFQEEEVTFERLPQIKQKNQRIWLPTDLPAIAEMSEMAYAQFLIDQIQILNQLEQPMIVLFNSNHILSLVSEGLSYLSVSHLARHVHGTATNIKKRFERGESKLLLGSSAFWEGVDFAEYPKVIIVLARLPFDNPRDPFIQKISQHLQREGKDGFQDYQLPLVIMKIKQAIGRASRNMRQKSAIVVLDNRILTKSYGRQIRHSLTKMCPVYKKSSAECLDGMAKFFR